MSFREDKNFDVTYENMKQEDKVNVEEASVNLGYVKKELNEEELAFEDNQYKIALTFDNVSGQSLTEQKNNRNSLIGFLDGDVVMKIETGTVTLEDVKEENKDLIQETIEQSHCNECGGNYQGYCLNCSSLSHILNNLVPNVNLLNTTPTNTLEIREVSRRSAVFALKTLPKGIILGPFEGIAPIESTTGLQWKIKDKNLVNDENGNWMKHIQSVANHGSKNLDVFQFDGILYFKTSREIQDGEELLVCYGIDEKEVVESDKQEEFYLVPVMKEEYPKVFACTLCCLGFRLERCLLEHKSKCPQANDGGSIEDFEIIQCHCCKVWLERQECMESHIMYCLEKYNRSCRNLPAFASTIRTVEEQVLEIEEKTTSIDVNASYSTPPTEPIGSNNCVSRADFKVRKEGYFHDVNMGTTHSTTKEYKCSACSYQTNRKGNLKIHLGTHTAIKDFDCDICKQRFGHKSNLKVHIRNKHSNTNEKEYKCSECSYQTNYKNSLKNHLVSHTGVKDFQCDICKQIFGHKNNLNSHIKYKHSNTNEKDYKCSECTYQTNHKGTFNIHLLSHTGVKKFQCDICKQRFGRKDYLKVHIKNRHSKATEKEYKCSECSYQTNRKSDLKLHLATHTDIKHFQCDICKQRFGRKDYLKVHIKNRHSKATEKEYKCSECCYQTNRKSDLKLHLVTHTDIKHFQCDICKQRFTQRGNLQRHIKNKH